MARSRLDAGAAGGALTGAVTGSVTGTTLAARQRWETGDTGSAVRLALRAVDATGPATPVTVVLFARSTVADPLASGGEPARREVDLDLADTALRLRAVDRSR